MCRAFGSGGRWGFDLFQVRGLYHLRFTTASVRVGCFVASDRPATDFAFC